MFDATAASAHQFVHLLKIINIVVDLPSICILHITLYPYFSQFYEVDIYFNILSYS